MLYPEQFITDDLMLLDIRLLPPKYRRFSAMTIKQFLEMGLKESGYLFVGENELCPVEASYPLYMTLCETIDLPPWDRPCTLHITLYDTHRLVIRHLREEAPKQQSVNLHTVSYAEWDTRLRDVLAPYHVYLDSPLVKIEDLIEATIDFLITQIYDQECRVHPEFEQYLMHALHSANSEQNSQSVLGNILLKLRTELVSVASVSSTFYLHTTDTKRRVVNLVFIDD